MAQPLIRIGELLSTGWDQFLADWKKNLELSIRFLLSSVVIFGAAFLTQNMPLAGQLVINVIALVAAAVINIHTMITLTDFVLRRDSNPTKPTEPSVEIGWKLFGPFIFVVALQTLAVLGGLALLVLPGIWLSVLFGYSILMFMEDGHRGTQALAASAELVKHHWWSVLFRSLASGIITGLLISFSTLILLIIVGLFVGMDQVFNFATYSANTVAPSPLVNGIESVIRGITSALFIPLGIIYQVKIFHSLKKSQM
ncbi:MAG: hypothetical protein WCK01_04120 [Candidatus Uhrbacteria bacterium]